MLNFAKNLSKSLVRMALFNFTENQEYHENEENEENLENLENRQPGNESAYVLNNVNENYQRSF
jgi:hypothetical protein